MFVCAHVPGRRASFDLDASEEKYVYPLFLRATCSVAFSRIRLRSSLVLVLLLVFASRVLSVFFRFFQFRCWCRCGNDVCVVLPIVYRVRLRFLMWKSCEVFQPENAIGCIRWFFNAAACTLKLLALLVLYFRDNLLVRFAEFGSSFFCSRFWRVFSSTLKFGLVVARHHESVKNGVPVSCRRMAECCR